MKKKKKKEKKKKKKNKKAHLAPYDITRNPSSTLHHIIIPSPPRMNPTTNQNIRPRHIRRSITQKEYRRRRHLIRPSNPSQRRCRLHQITRGFRRPFSRASRLIRLNERRTDRIDSNALGRQLRRKRLRKHLHPPFRHIITRHPKPRQIDVCRNTRDKHHAAPRALLLELLHG